METGESVPLELVPALTIKIDFEAGCRITITGHGIPLIVANEKFSEGNLRALRIDVTRRLNEVSDMLLSPNRAMRDGMVALRKLHKLGYYVLLMLVGDEREELPKIVHLVRSACTGHGLRTGLVPRWDTDAPPAKLVIFKTSVDHGIPIDLLPLLDLDPEVAGGSEIDQLGRLASSFLGFSAIVKREMGTVFAKPRYLENIPKLPVKMFINRSLEGALQEEDHFLKNVDIDVEPGGWPKERHSEDEFPTLLAAHLWEVGTRFGGSPRQFPDQICHFSCHSYAGGDRPQVDYKIELQSHPLVGRRKATLEDLTVAFDKLVNKNAGDRRPRPLIFMNSCGSGDLDPSGAASFPNLFLNQRLGFMGFIGTETTMPDQFAAEFSRVFYKNLIHGASLGQSMLLTRWELLKTYRNSLGLMYTLFAEPEIRVRSRVPEQIVTRKPHRGILAYLADMRRFVGFQRGNAK